MKKNRSLLALAFLGFISLGLPDTINGVIWPSVSETLGAPLGHLSFLLIAFMAGYLASSLSIVHLLKLLGVGGLLAASGALVSISLFGYALSPSWPIYLGFGLVAGAAGGAIDTGLNAYAARHFSAKHMTWLHACWGVGASLGTLIVTSFFAKDFDYRWPLSFIALVMIPISALFFVVRKKWHTQNETNNEEASEIKKTLGISHAIRNRVALLQAFIFVMYVGFESVVGNWAYTLLTKDRGVDAVVAGTIVSCYWLSITFGRFFFGSFADRIRPRMLILSATYSALAAGAVFSLSASSLLSLFSLIVIGFSLAPIYPSMMSQTPARMGELSDATVGLQISGALFGQVAMPALGGLLIAAFGISYVNVLILALVVFLAVAMTFLFRVTTELATAS